MVAIIPPFEVFESFEIPAGKIFQQAATNHGGEKDDYWMFTKTFEQQHNTEATTAVDWQPGAMQNAAVHKSASFEAEKYYFPNPANESTGKKDNNIVTDCVFGGIFVGSRFAISFASHMIYSINIAYDYNKKDEKLQLEMGGACYNEVRDRSILAKRRCNALEEKERCNLIWHGYCRVKNQMMVIRSGFGMYGVYPYDLNEPIVEVRSESDAEHAYGCGVLINLIAMHFPEMITPEEAFWYKFLMDVHDLGECDDGDIPDDGKRDEELKNRRELQTIMKFGETFLPGKNADLTAFFREFQSRSTKRGRNVFCLDKVETVLQGLRYESTGHGGDISVKMKTVELSAQDKRNMEMTGSTALVDIWAAHFLEVTRGMVEARIPRLILRAATENVRGEWFPWAEKYDVTW